jgi:hypothetical protein
MPCKEEEDNVKPRGEQNIFIYFLSRGLWASVQEFINGFFAFHLPVSAIKHQISMMLIDIGGWWQMKSGNRFFVENLRVIYDNYC